MSDYYDRQGNPMPFDAYIKAHANREYKRVAATTLPDGKWVSTVWLGLDHGWGEGSPVIFETMVFNGAGAGGGDIECRRYATEEQAKAGHEATVAKWTANPNGEPYGD